MEKPDGTAIAPDSTGPWVGCIQNIALLSVSGFGPLCKPGTCSLLKRHLRLLSPHS